MRLGEITNDQIISITVSRGETSASLSTDVAFVEGEVLYVKPFMYNNSVVTFAAPDISIEMMALKEDSVPYYWKSISISKVSMNGETYHKITSGLEGVRLNRRTAFRVFVGEHGDCIITSTNKKIPIIVRDISANGIGILVDEEYAVDLGFGTKVQIHYQDDAMRFIADVIARVVRTVAADKGFIYGCEFSCMYPQVSKYAAAKQLKQRKDKKP